MSSFDNGTILESSIGTILKSSIGTMLESSIGMMLGSYVGTMLESSTESVLHFDIHPTPIQCRNLMSFRHWNVGYRHRNDIVPILEPRTWKILFLVLFKNFKSLKIHYSKSFNIILK